MKTRCVLIRHGRTKGNIEKRYLGCHMDEPLCEEGIKELSPVPEAKASDPVFTSPMQRARQTADIMFPENKKTVIPELTETDFGRFEGKNYEELNGDAEYQAWVDSGGSLPFPGGEAIEDFIARSYEGFLKAALAMWENGSDTMWVVAHGGTVMAILSRLTGRSYYDFMVDCGKGYELSFDIEEAGRGIVFEDTELKEWNGQVS